MTSYFIEFFINYFIVGLFFNLFCSYAGDVEINVEVKKYFCKAGVKGIQVRKRTMGLLKDNR